MALGCVNPMAEWNTKLTEFQGGSSSDADPNWLYGKWSTLL